MISGSTASAAERPNILYFYVDDMGWGSIGPNGQAERKANGLPYVRTPHLDRLAAEGVNFTRGYGCHVCSPARSSQQSGFHQGHTFADRNDPDNAKKAMRADDILMGDALSAAGYTTGYWGKWGYGGSKDRARPVIQNVQTLPTSHGYQHVLAELHHVRAHTFFQPTLWSAPPKSKPSGSRAIGGLELVPNSLERFKDNESYPTSPALQDSPHYPETAYCDDSYAFAALDFVRAQGVRYNQTKQPFFGLLAVQIPHAPFGEIATLPEWDREYANDPSFRDLSPQTRQWAAMVTRIDAHFGNILDALDDPNHDGDKSDSIADDTLVLFQSDNGGPRGRNNVELNANGGLRGSKGSIQEGGIRVPLVMRWPARINRQSTLRSGEASDMVVDVTDLLPTFCELAGAPCPLGIDGVSIAPTLRGSGHQRRREFIIHEAGNGQSIIRGNLKLVRAKKAPLQLFDLALDPSESKNIAAANPKAVQQLEELLLGERVTEPKGFANTYHSWIGEDGDSATDPDHWSDYEYANAGVTYIADRGAPKSSWIAKLHNHDGKVSAAHADADLEFLGLEIQGDVQSRATQSLVLGPGVSLTGRNEIRLKPHSELTLDHGAISSLRWIEIHSRAALRGAGAIGATVYNDGLFEIAGRRHPQIAVHKDYHQSANGELRITLGEERKPTLSIRGAARFDGLLSVEVPRGLAPQAGEAYTIITAESIVGKFANANDELVTSDGRRFKIRYSASAVELLTP